MSFTILEVLIEELNKWKKWNLETKQTKVSKKQVTHTRNLKCVIDFVVNLDWFA